MADEINMDNLSDDDIDSLLDGIDSGEYNETPEADETEDEIGAEEEELNEESEDESEEDATNNEDTDQEDEPEEDDDTNDDDQETPDADEEDEEEDTPVDEDTKDTEDKDSETNGDTQDTVKIDQAEHDKYKKFYDEVVNAEFTANGKKVKGFTDPQKIIQSQQMAYGYSDKMAGFKQYKPYMAPLKERGYLENPEKFNLALDLADGNEEALKKHIKDKGYDVLGWDLDEGINYKAKEHRASEGSIAINEAMERADAAGVGEKLRNVVGEQWDDASAEEFVKDAGVRNDLIDQMQNGVYDLVQDRIASIKATDYKFADVKSTDQYRYALNQLTEEYNKQESQKQAEVDKTAGVEAEKAKIVKEQETKAYKAKVEKKNKQVDEQRKKVTNVSKKKKPAKKAAKFDPMKLDGDDLDKFVDSLIEG